MGSWMQVVRSLGNGQEKMDKVHGHVQSDLYKNGITIKFPTLKKAIL